MVRRLAIATLPAIMACFLLAAVGASAVGSVNLITHWDQLDGINWPNDVSVSVGAACAPQDTGIPAQSCQPAATSGQATVTSHPVSGGIDASDTAVHEDVAAAGGPVRCTSSSASATVIALDPVTSAPGLSDVRRWLVSMLS